MIHRFQTSAGVVCASAAFLGGVLLASPAGADPGADVEQAVSAARGGASCPGFRHNDVATQAADIINRSTKAYLAHDTAIVPADNPQPTAILKDLGVETQKAKLLQGAGHSAADAIKASILQGFKEIPDCSYTDIGASMLIEEQTGYVVIAAVLLGQ